MEGQASPAHTAPRCYTNYGSFGWGGWCWALRRPGAGGGLPARHSGLPHRDDRPVLPTVPGRAAGVSQQREPAERVVLLGQRGFILLHRAVRRSPGGGHLPVPTAPEEFAGGGHVSRSGEGGVTAGRAR